MLLTGDLNLDGQESLLADYEGHPDEFISDVVKGCHHGSEDVSVRVLETMEPMASIISSCDNEGHDHPRPSIVAAYALTGHKEIENDRLITPLVYSTELARSVGVGTPTEVNVYDEEGDVIEARSEVEPKKTCVTYKEIKPGDRSPSTRTRPPSARKIAARLVYGLIVVAAWVEGVWRRP
jgi:hypothetical protein